MPVHETERIVEISDRKWKIRKFDALTGSYIALKLASKLSSIAVGVFSGNVTDKAVIAMAISNEIGTMTKQEILEIEAECLYICKEVKLVGEKEVEVAVRMPDGTWGVEGMETNALLIMALVGHALIFNLSSFFDENALKVLKNSFADLKFFNA